MRSPSEAPVVTPPHPVLQIHDLETRFRSAGGLVRAVDGVSYDINAAEIVAIVGESGCGKSITALSAMRLIKPPGEIAGGEVWLDGVDLLRLDEPAMRRMRGNRIAMIFQEPMTALNPVLRIGRQIGETLILHKGLSERAARERTVGLLARVGLSDPEQRERQYPHELSGGMRQRAMIALGLACDPLVLFADEPTTALDVTIQAQILALLKDLMTSSGTGIALITHDLGVVAEVADRIVVMYAGCKVEEGSADDVLQRPRHPYTLGLLRSKPSLDAELDGTAPSRLAEIAGIVPVMTDAVQGCAFTSRCPLATPICAERPPLIATGHGRVSACWHADRVQDLADDC